MRIVCIDAGPVNGGATSRAVRGVADAAREAGAEVECLRLYDLYASTCSSCGACATSGRCSSHDGRIAALASLFSSAHCMAVAAAASLGSSNPIAEALLERLLRQFAGLPDDAVRRPRVVPAPSRRVRAVVLVACPPALAPAVRLGRLSGGAAGVRHALTRAGLHEAQYLPVSNALTAPGTRERLARKSRAVGEMLAAYSPLIATTGSFDQRKRRAERHHVGHRLAARHA